MSVFEQPIAPTGETWQIAELENFPPPEKWRNWEEYDSKAWPRRVKKTYDLVPTICFNCEAACGLIAYVEKETQKIRKVEKGNPYHPDQRGQELREGAGDAGCNTRIPTASSIR